jgi:hypothetical protein
VFVCLTHCKLLLRLPSDRIATGFHSKIMYTFVVINVNNMPLYVCVIETLCKLPLRRIKGELQKAVEEMAIIHFEVFYYSWD